MDFLRGIIRSREKYRQVLHSGRKADRRRIIKSAKRTEWRSFDTSSSERTPESNLWKWKINWCGIFSRAQEGSENKCKISGYLSSKREIHDRRNEEVRLINTADGFFMGKKEAAWLGLAGSALLVGKKWIANRSVFSKRFFFHSELSDCKINIGWQNRNAFDNKIL